VVGAMVAAEAALSSWKARTVCKERGREKYRYLCQRAAFVYQATRRPQHCAVLSCRERRGSEDTASKSKTTARGQEQAASPHPFCVLDAFQIRWKWQTFRMRTWNC
jgi:hypothetical protein